MDQVSNKARFSSQLGDSCYKWWYQHTDFNTFFQSRKPWKQNLKDLWNWIFRTSKKETGLETYNPQSRHLSWRLGVLGALVISILVLLTNISLLIVGGVGYKGYMRGIGTLDSGASSHIQKTGAGLYVLINILSTALLISSDHCIQILSAPSREDLDFIHSRKGWLDIGIISFRNICYIKRLRFIFWLILRLSSLPLHLL